MFKRAAGGSKPALRIAIAPLSKVLCSKFSAQTQELHTFQIAFEMLCEGSSLADENREAISRLTIELARSIAPALSLTPTFRKSNSISQCQHRR